MVQIKATEQNMIAMMSEPQPFPSGDLFSYGIVNYLTHSQVLANTWVHAEGLARPAVWF